MNKPIIFFAPNVGSGGGLVLLTALLATKWGGAKVTAFLDVRAQEHLKKHIPSSFVAIWCKPTLIGRLRAEWMLARMSTADHLIVCFHNLPPLFPTHATVHCFVQNANIVGLIPSASLGPRLKLRCYVEKQIAWLNKHRVAKYFVQTPTMREALLSWYGADTPPVIMAPFLDKPAIDAHHKKRNNHDERKWDFIYVSDGAVHKNHRRLFQAWKLLAELGEFPTLAVTLHPKRDALLRQELARLIEHYPIYIEDLGQLPHTEILKIYHHARALLFPSTAESFGIPLIEAGLAGLPIIAPELDYVRDICNPIETFDPNSERSIARAVLRFLRARSDIASIKTPSQFLEAILQVEK